MLSILNKNNYGFITPTDFNLYAKISQIEVFEEFFLIYASWLNKENNRLTSTGFSDVRKTYEEFIEIFVEYESLSPIVPGESVYNIPADHYRTESISTVIPSGETRELEKVSKQDLNRLSVSKKLAPDILFPVYNGHSKKISVFPVLANLELAYVRYPKEPKWTYRDLVGGAPMFDPNQFDYQDFEVPQALETKLIKKILQLSGMSIREIEAVQFGAAQEQRENETKR